MNQTWERLGQRFDALSARERLMVFVAGVAVIAGLGFLLFLDSALTKQKLLEARVQKSRAELAQLQGQSAELARLLTLDPDEQTNRRIEELKRKLGGYENELRGVQQGLVPPRQMARVLEDMLNRDVRVRLVKLRTLPVSALVDSRAGAATATAKATPAGKNTVYKHGIELTLAGSYLDLLEYQSRLEKLPWRMFFARATINSVDYPRVFLTVTLYTLSLEEAWLVV